MLKQWRLLLEAHIFLHWKQSHRQTRNTPPSRPRSYTATTHRTETELTKRKSRKGGREKNVSLSKSFYAFWCSKFPFQKSVFSVYFFIIPFKNPSCFDKKNLTKPKDIKQTRERQIIDPHPPKQVDRKARFPQKKMYLCRIGGAASLLIQKDSMKVDL